VEMIAKTALKTKSPMTPMKPVFKIDLFIVQYRIVLYYIKRDQKCKSALLLRYYR
jgi:hypothetical protein